MSPTTNGRTTQLFIRCLIQMETISDTGKIPPCLGRDMERVCGIDDRWLIETKLIGKEIITKGLTRRERTKERAACCCLEQGKNAFVPGAYVLRFCLYAIYKKVSRKTLPPVHFGISKLRQGCTAVYLSSDDNEMKPCKPLSQRDMVRSF